jgi:pyruvate ferredoxin oxidoreductase gamma subunit
MGAPVMAFCRLDNKEIRLREPVLNPDALIIQDPTLLHQVDLFQGLDANGFMLINSTRSFEQLGLAEFARGFRAAHLRTVPATEIALKHVGRAVPNAALLGGFAALSGEVKLASVLVAIRDKFPHALAEKNVAAAAEAYEFVAATLEACVA